MYPKQHFFIGLAFSLLLFLVLPSIGLLGIITITLSSVLIDADHYLYYIYKKKDPSLKNSYYWFRENIKKVLALPEKQRLKFYHGLYIFHGLEILLMLLILSIFVSKHFLFILTGFNLHLFLDLLTDYKNYTKSYKYSIFVNLVYSKKLKHFKE
ncbi:MAG: metal-dependent hydrolase [Nanoarchaeota archaeon]